ncbi:hypothetical protein WJX77_008995 [Trebouxia sp. C0004]
MMITQNLLPEQPSTLPAKQRRFARPFPEQQRRSKSGPRAAIGLIVKTGMARRRVQYGIVNASDADVVAAAPGFRASWQSKEDLRQQVMKWDDPDDLPGPEGDPLRIKVVCPQDADQPSKAMVPQDFSRVGSTQANRVLASLEISECVGNEVDPIVVSSSTPASQGFDFSEYANENAGTRDLLKHHQVELIKFGVEFGRDVFTMYDLHEHRNPYPIVHAGQEYHGGLDGGIAPHGLSKSSAANQLRVAYEHKQSNDQKQRYSDQYGDLTEGQISAGALTDSGGEKGQSVIATLGCIGALVKC